VCIPLQNRNHASPYSESHAHLRTTVVVVVVVVVVVAVVAVVVVVVVAVAAVAAVVVVVVVVVVAVVVAVVVVEFAVAVASVLIVSTAEGGLDQELHQEVKALTLVVKGASFHQAQWGRYHYHLVYHQGLDLVGLAVQFLAYLGVASQLCQGWRLVLLDVEAPAAIEMVSR